MAEIEIPEPLLLDRLGGEEVYGFGQDGDVTIAANTTLTRDMYYNNLTINSSCTLDTNGYRVFVRGTLAFSDSSSRIGRFTNKTTAGTLKGGFGKGIDATDTLGGASGEQGGSHDAGDEFFKGDNEMFNLTVALLGKKFDPSDGTTKFIGGGSGGADGAITAAAGEGADGGDSNWSDYQVVGAAGGKGSPGNAATAGTGAVGGGVVLGTGSNFAGDYRDICISEDLKLILGAEQGKLDIYDIKQDKWSNYKIGNQHDIFCVSTFDDQIYIGTRQGEILKLNI